MISSGYKKITSIHAIETTKVTMILQIKPGGISTFSGMFTDNLPVLIKAYDEKHVKNSFALCVQLGIKKCQTLDTDLNAERAVVRIAV